MNAGKAAFADVSTLPMLANHCENHIKRLLSKPVSENDSQ